MATRVSKSRLRRAGRNKRTVKLHFDRVRIRRAEPESEYRTLLEDQSKLEISRARYVELYDAAPVGYVTLSRSGLIEEVNLMGAQLLGLPRSQLFGSPLAVFIAKADQPKFLRFLSSMRRRPERRSAHLELQGKAVRPACVELIAIPSVVEKNRPDRFQCALVDISARRKAENDLRASEEKFRTLASHAPVGIFLCDKNGDNIYVNETWCAMADFTSEHARGKGWLRTVHPDDRERVTSGWDKAVREGMSSSAEFRCVRPDGGIIWVHGHAVRLKDAEGQFAGYIGTVADITERKRAEAGWRHIHEQTLIASRAKDDFLAALSHELRTPLNPALLVASEAAGNPNLPPSVRADFETIRKNVELEARLIDDILDITRISHGKLKIDLQPAGIHTILSDAISIVQDEMKRKRITLTLKLTAKKQIVLGDATRLQQIFWNILKNAVKFTPENGAISVKTETGNSGLIVKIADTGIGMSVEEINRLFMEFSQGAHAGFGGLGLGLAISRKLAELHNGSIRASSQGKGRGATFTIELPLARRPGRISPAAEHISSGRVALPLPEKQAQSVSILLVEDHEPTRATLARLLLRRHFQVKTAASLAEARTLAGKQDFDLLISDLGLPDGSGYDLMMEFQQQHPMKGIALTGYGTEGDIARSDSAGFIAHLTKPVNVESLENALSRALQK